MSSGIDRPIERTTASGERLRLSCARLRVCRLLPFRRRAGILLPNSSRLAPMLRLLLIALLGICPCALAQNPPPILAPSSPPPPPNTAQSSDHRLKASVDLVVLHVTVTNDRGE